MDGDNNNFFKRTFLPTYDEPSLFVMGLSFFLIFCADLELRLSVQNLVMDGDVRSFFAGGIFFMGMLLSVYHFFSARPKSDFEKYAMLAFVVLANASAGWVAGMRVLDDTIGWLAVFPLWNILTAVMLLLFWRFKLINESNISDENAGSFLELILSITAVIVIFSVCKFWLKLHWSEIYSICVVYATNINAMGSQLLQEKAQSAKQ